MWNRTKSRAETLVKELQSVANNNMNLSVSDTVRSACSDADIVCTVTSSSVPIVFRDHVKPGQFLYQEYLSHVFSFHYLALALFWH